jgi:nitric oxide dioxygenase
LTLFHPHSAFHPPKVIDNPTLLRIKLSTRIQHTYTRTSNLAHIKSTSPPTSPFSTSTMATLTPTQVEIIKSTVPVLAQHGNTITTQFYANMLAANPALKNIFNNTHQATGHQAAALAGALYAYAANIDNLGALSPALELICHKHVSLYIRPEHYGIVGTYLIQTMKTVLGEAATPEILDAWGAAYWQLANLMIQKEDAMYKTTSGWDEWKDFKIAKKEKESEDITSFYLEPVEAMTELPVFKPGQYISVNVFVEELDGGVWQARQYSLSDAPGKKYLRISVKKEPGIEIGNPKHLTHEGYISNILHEKKNEGDVIRVSHPFGDFFFDEAKEEKDTPVVLISAGVGLTCLLSILNALVENKSSRPISWIHGARNSNTRAFKKDIDALAANNKNVHAVYFSSSPKEGELLGRDYAIKGRINLDEVSKEVLFIDNVKTQYFTCGSTQFMLDVEKRLKEYGVPAERVKMEKFGTGGVPRV